MRFTPQCRDLAWLLETPIAHRGLHGNGIVENTEDAFAAAVRADYAIECDLQISSDGEAMVFHDETINRLIEGNGWVRNFTAKQLKAMTFKNSKNRIQTLGEMLDQIKEDVPLVIELKSHWDRNETLACRAIDVLHSYAGPCSVMSFDPFLMTVLAEDAPHIVRGITADRCVDDYYKFLPFQQRIAMQQFAHLNDTRPDFISYYFRDLPFAVIQRLRAAGFPVISWTIRSKQQAEQARRFSDQITFEGFAA